MCASSNLKNFSPNGQNDQQLNSDPSTWPPCERCGNPAPLRTQWGSLCDECYAIVADQAVHIVAEPDDSQLCALMAAHSGRTGDRFLLRLAREELEARARLKETLRLCSDAQAEIKTSRRSFLSGLFGAVALAALPLRPIEPGRPLHPTVTQWQRRLDAAIAPLEALRDGIGQPITGEQFYALERAVFGVLGELVEAMECGPFNELIIALGIETGYLRAVGIWDQYTGERAAYEAEVSDGR